MTRNRNVKYLVYSLELLILFVLQGTPGLIPPILGVKPVLVLGAVITIALLEPEVPALFFGLGAGLLLDLGVGSSFGLSAMITAALCCMVSVLVKKKIHVTLFSGMTTGAMVLLVAILLDWLFRYVLAGYALPALALVDQFLPRYLYTLLLFPLMYLLNLGLFLGFRPVEDGEAD